MAERAAAFKGGFWTTVGVLAALVVVGFLLSGRR